MIKVASKCFVHKIPHEIGQRATGGPWKSIVVLKRLEQSLLRAPHPGTSVNQICHIISPIHPTNERILSLIYFNAEDNWIDSNRI